jgi:hypothetical protein
MKPEWDQPTKMVNGRPDWASIFKTKFTMGATSDIEYSGYKETQQRVFGWELYFMGALVAHKSKACRSGTLSSAESEYYALSEVTKEVILQYKF